ncbi:hypothetical protein GGR21_001010 [Dysgonomonas hofstadii]|uniref:CarboxypepD_reg-like domain-containing protein n=1 Tax=Dysgonomonas hofstadii TaxID=637886 RepID=A0A840CIW7_9BACT|nr:carboxypeptidase-like regulatory domain-containing protein [Dysgonomonas hofstadii]MBB4035121.1 hypothetical protein [Dysgonomonas hofstadii]
MKTIYLRTAQLFILLLTSGFIFLHGQEMSYTTINGIVKDSRNNKKLEYASISVQGTGIGTVTNSDGTFSIKINDSLQAKALEVRHLGYENRTYPIKNNNEKDITIYLSSNTRQLKDIVIVPDNMTPRKLVETAMGKIAENNPDKVNLLTGFYRETIKKRRNYINISEAIINIYKTPYSEDASRDKVQVYKGRKLLSPKLDDTLAVKFIGGPNLSTYMDVVKNPNFFLDEEMLSLHEFEWDESVMINERPHYVVKFKPNAISPYALYFGKLYIDQENLAFSQADINLSMDDKDKVSKVILRKKPFKLRFKPEEVTFLITYKQDNGISYLSYIRNEVRFKCDWKRKLFSTGYTIVSEMVVTDRKEDNVEKISNKLAFDAKNSLSEKVSSFLDPGFWEDYNIIEPTESLEDAVNKLKKQHDK